MLENSVFPVECTPIEFTIKVFPDMNYMAGFVTFAPLDGEDYRRGSDLLDGEITATVLSEIVDRISKRLGLT